MSYVIDTSVFENNKKYELSFSFSSSCCILNQYAKIPSVYVNLGNLSTENKTYTFENNGSYMVQSNFLGFLKINNVYNSNNTNSLNNPSYSWGNTQFSTLTAEPSNIPIIINKPNCICIFFKCSKWN